MTGPDPLTSSTIDRLRGHIIPELHDHLTQTGSLPPDVVRAECDRLRDELTALATYIPSALVRAQIAHPQPGHISGASWDGSVLFADLSGFTAMSEQLTTLGKQGAEELSAIINQLFGALVEEIHRYHGILLKFGGDALTAFFSAEMLGARHARLACRSALAMQERMEEFAALSTRAGTFRLRLRIGVHSGQVFAAQVGDLSHIELVVTGRNINRVAMAQEIAEPGEVVISDATLALLPDISLQERQKEFYLLSELPGVLAPPPTNRWEWDLRSNDIAELVALAERIEALRPYLPCGLPRRFLTNTYGGADSGEFRPVTVLFANFFPFSKALDILDDDYDTAARVLNAYYRRAQEVIHRYGGIVNKVDMYTYGDKLMALFGAPIAHEDDPQRAVRAALDLRSMLTEANAEIVDLLRPVAEPLIPIEEDFFKQCIGINTGVVFAGQVGSAQRHEYTVMGQHVNLAARLMSAAKGGTIILSPSTRRVVQHHFALGELPPLKLKGVAEPVPVAEVLQPFAIAKQSRQGLTRPVLVGRESEMERLLAEGRMALGGRGRVITLTGEAGTGKTRLIEDTLRNMILLSGRDNLPVFFTYSIECQSYDQSTPYAVIRSLLRQFFNLNPDDALHQQMAMLNQQVQELAPDLVRFTPLLGDFLSLPIEDTPLTAALTPEQRHDRAQELVETLILAEAQRQPLVFVIDDLHWIDASSLDMLASLARNIANAPMLLLLSYRLDPPIAEPWKELEHALRLTVRELSAVASNALVRALLRSEPPPELIMLLEKTQGNPFYIEEVVRGLVESGTLQQTDNGWQLSRSLDEVAVPDSIEGVIIARIDRLDERNREVLQIASVIGRRFPYPVLSGVTTRRLDLMERLNWLISAELIEPEEAERDLSYLFKQALTRDVVYEAILYARRRDLHRRVAEQIEQSYRARLDEQLALLARHYLLAEEWAAAFDYHLRAGRQAQAQYANQEAITLFERALQLGARLTVSRVAEEIQLLEQLGIIQALIGEYDTALERYQAALNLMRQQPSTPIDDLVRLHCHVARVYEKRAAFEIAFEWIEQAMDLAGATESLELVRCLLLGTGLHLRQGRYGQALDWGERALSQAERLGSLRDQAEAYMQLGSTYNNLGDNVRAFELTSECLRLYEQVQDLARLADAHNNLATICHELGRLAEARTHYEAGAEIKQAIGDIYGQAMIANNLGDLLRIQEKLDEASEQYRRSLAIFERLGSLYAAGVLHMNLGTVHVLRGDLAIAEEHLRNSARLFEQAGAEDFLPELERSYAELYIRAGNLKAAKQACERSLIHAARLEARTEEGQTRRTIGQILAQEGDLVGAWAELEHSLNILREAAYSHEIAKTLLAMAALASTLGKDTEGRAAVAEAMPLLHNVGAQGDIQRAHLIAAHLGIDVHE